MTAMTLVADDGSLVSFIKLFGRAPDHRRRSNINGSSIRRRSSSARASTAPAMRCSFISCATRPCVGQDIDRVMRSNRAAARAHGTGSRRFVATNAAAILARYMAHEEIYIVLWTRPSVLEPRPSCKDAIKQRGEKKWVTAPNAQYPMQALEALRTRHAAMSSSIMRRFEEIGMKAAMVEDA